MLQRIAGAVALLALYVGAVVWLTWPLAAFLSTHLPRTHIAARLDGYLSVWVLAWESHALTSAPWQLANANIYHPAPHALFYGVTGFGALPYFAPVFLATGNPTLAMNVTFLGCVAASAWTLHLVVRWWTGSHLGGMVAASVLLTNPFVLRAFVPFAPVYAALQYFPLIAYFAATLPHGRGGGARLALLVTLQCLTDVVYVAPAVLAPLGCLAVFRLVRPSTRSAGVRLAGAMAIALLALAPIYVGYGLVARANPRLWQQSLWLGPAPPIRLPEGLLSLATLSPLPGVLAALVIAGAISALLRARRGDSVAERGAWAHGALWVTVGILVSLTPVVLWHNVALPTPQLLLSRWIPALRSLRAPRRLGIAGLFGFAILGGVAFAECTRWIHWRGRLAPRAPVVRAALAVLVIARLYAGYVQAPSEAEPLPALYPLVEAPQMSERLLASVRARSGPLLELPVGPYPIDLHTTAMYRSIAHWRPLLNGYGSYWPARFPLRMALATALPDPTALAALVQETGLTTILVHTRFTTPAKWTEWLAARNRGDVQLVAVDDADYLFEVTARTEGPR